MSKRVESIEITFENLDYINIPAEYFGEFYITGIQTTVERLALNAIVQRTRADQIEFELLARVDVALSDMSRDLSFLPEENLSLLKRIENRKDIAYRTALPMVAAALVTIPLAVYVSKQIPGNGFRSLLGSVLILLSLYFLVFHKIFLLSFDFFFLCKYLL